MSKTTTSKQTQSTNFKKAKKGFFQNIVEKIQEDKNSFFKKMGIGLILLSVAVLFAPLFLGALISFSAALAFSTVLLTSGVAATTIGLTHQFEKPEFKVKEDFDEVKVDNLTIKDLKKELQKVNHSISSTLKCRLLTRNEAIRDRNKMLKKDAKNLWKKFDKIENKLKTESLIKSEKEELIRELENAKSEIDGLKESEKQLLFDDVCEKALAINDIRMELKKQKSNLDLFFIIISKDDVAKDIKGNEELIKAVELLQKLKDEYLKDTDFKDIYNATLNSITDLSTQYKELLTSDKVKTTDFLFIGNEKIKTFEKETYIRFVESCKDLSSKFNCANGFIRIYIEKSYDSVIKLNNKDLIKILEKTLVDNPKDTTLKIGDKSKSRESTGELKN